MGVKLAFLLWDIDYGGGGETVTKLLAKAFSSKNMEVTILSVFGENIPAMENIQIFSLYKLKKVLDKSFEIDFSVFLRKNLSNIDYLIVQERNIHQYVNMRDILPSSIKIITVYHACPCLDYQRVTRPEIYLNKGRFLQFKRIFFSLILFFNSYYYLCKSKKYLVRILQSTDKLIFLCPEAYEIVKNIEAVKLELFQEKCAIIPNPVLIKDTKNFELKKYKVLFVGRVSEDKGVYDLLKIWNIINSQKHGWKLLLAGSVLDEEIGKQLNEVENLELLGFCENMESVYESVDILVHTSFFEGLPMAIIEASSYGIVPIAFDCPTGPKDIIHNGVDGFVIEDRNIDSFVDKLNLLFNSDNLLLNMKKAAIQNSKKYDIDEIVNVWEDDYLK